MGSRLRAKYFTYINPQMPIQYLIRDKLLRSPFHRCGNWGLNKLSYLPKVSELDSNPDLPDSETETPFNYTDSM